MQTPCCKSCLTRVIELQLDKDFFASKPRASGRAMFRVRFGQEWDVGHFEGAERPKCETFAEMTPETLGLGDANKEEPVMIYCTGGIRCPLKEIPKKHLLHSLFAHVSWKDRTITSINQQGFGYSVSDSPLR